MSTVDGDLKPAVTEGEKKEETQNQHLVDYAKSLNSLLIL